MIYKMLLASIPFAILFADDATQVVRDARKAKEEGPITHKYNNEVFLKAEFIYWLAQQEGNEYAATGSAITVPGTVDPNTSFTPESITSSGKVYKPDSVMEPGYKVGIGVNMAHGKWDVFLQYTYLFSKAKSSVSSDNLNTGILPLFSYTPNNSVLDSATYAVSSGATGFVSAARSNWNLHFDMFDFEMGKEIPIHYSFTLRPYFGLKGGWQTEFFQAFYTVSSYSTFDELGSNRVISSQNYWGVGPRVGLDGKWGGLNGFGLFATSAISLMWSHFQNTAKSYDTNTTYTNVLIADQVFTLNTMNPVVELQIGAKYAWQFKTRRRFWLEAAWEGQIWFYQNQHSSVIADLSLILQGLTASAGFEF